MVRNADRQSIKIISFPKDKDESDLELAILHASESCASVTIVDSGGGRLDHLWGSILNMASEATSMITCEAFSGLFLCETCQGSLHKSH